MPILDSFAEMAVEKNFMVLIDFHFNLKGEPLTTTRESKVNFDSV